MHGVRFKRVQPQRAGQQRAGARRKQQALGGDKHAVALPAHAVQHQGAAQRAFGRFPGQRVFAQARLQPGQRGVAAAGAGQQPGQHQGEHAQQRQQCPRRAAWPAVKRCRFY